MHVQMPLFTVLSCIAHDSLSANGHSIECARRVTMDLFVTPDKKTAADKACVRHSHDPRMEPGSQFEVVVLQWEDSEIRAAHDSKDKTFAGAAWTISHRENRNGAFFAPLQVRGDTSTVLDKFREVVQHENPDCLVLAVVGEVPVPLIETAMAELVN